MLDLFIAYFVVYVVVVFVGSWINYITEIVEDKALVLREKIKKWLN